MSNSILSLIDKQIKNHDIVLYMKGTSDSPKCGFSALVVNILQTITEDFKNINCRYVDVMSDTDIRQGIKDYADWPTIPQLYIKGEFIGGCDIVKEMYINGELQKLLLKKFGQ